jgi:hypothetical protein
MPALKHRKIEFANRIRGSYATSRRRKVPQSGDGGRNGGTYDEEQERHEDFMI